MNIDIYWRNRGGLGRRVKISRVKRKLGRLKFKERFNVVPTSGGADQLLNKRWYYNGARWKLAFAKQYPLTDAQIDTWVSPGHLMASWNV